MAGPVMETYPTGLKRCSKCHQEKPLDQFCWRQTRWSKVKRPSGPCRDCNRAAVAAWHAADPNRRRAQGLRAFGLTVEQYEAMLVAQEGRCAVCRAEPGEKRLAVDHDHATGEVRGLLCELCNRGIGMLRDDPGVLAAAIKYLSR